MPFHVHGGQAEGRGGLSPGGRPSGGSVGPGVRPPPPAQHPYGRASSAPRARTLVTPPVRTADEAVAVLRRPRPPIPPPDPAGYSDCTPF